jgi:hypothetical protein
MMGCTAQCVFEGWKGDERLETFGDILERESWRVHVAAPLSRVTLRMGVHVQEHVIRGIPKDVTDVVDALQSHHQLFVDWDQFWEINK